MNPNIRSGKITALPNPVDIASNGQESAAEITLGWESTAATVAVCVGSPSGQVFAATSGGRHSAKTGRWVTDGMTFFLQDISEKQPLSREYTLAKVTVRFAPAARSPGNVSAPSAPKA